jgi:hypothetical protein
MAALAEVFAEPGPLRAGAAEVGDPLAVLPVLVAMLWRGGLSADLDYWQASADSGAGPGSSGRGAPGAPPSKVRRLSAL